MTRDHNDRIRDQFRRQATTFDATGFAIDGLDWITGHIAPQTHDVALDVAAGAGHLGRALAPHVAHVVCLDLTPEMLHQGQRLADGERLRNITFQQGDAGALPWIDRQFDLVVCRLAAHQVRDPELMIHEMVRVARTGGTVVVADMVVASPDTAEATNRLERLRDPSHHRTLDQREIEAMLIAAGATVRRCETAEIAVDLSDWLQRTQTPPDARAAIVSRLEEDIKGGRSTGMHPRRRADGAFEFTHPWVTVIAER
ncbi:class I SAM-dependent methyltransferase [Mycobacterium sp. 236(2023)]|nr:class I SAM-dependent methyltransferase [Mycobacterium sp. 236(2023)]MDG4669374.1 class I SAM-dependent methyltransferase [Mycobacterium sp. 236(2023)]